ncbi:MAG: hypothetical protein MJE68_14115, partial [Proteobacteria bacterium]|nr:hypothetical protein [Pseudomonadota bacterium]
SINNFHLQGPLTCDVYKIACIRKTCFLEYSGELHSLFFLSNMTAAGDEIGWDFISAVKTTKTSFTSFCNEMTRKYTTTNPLSAPFMSPNTFLKWLFSWIGSMNIDFRKDVDPWCLYNPKVLACDGTHIGVSIKHLNLTTPVTKADSSHGPVAPHHKRYI